MRQNPKAPNGENDVGQNTEQAGKGNNIRVLLSRPLNCWIAP